MTRRHVWLAVPVLLSGCTGTPEAPRTQPLVDLLGGDGVVIVDTPVPTAPPRARWRFDEPGTGEAGLHGWRDGGGISGLTVRDGLLTGKTTTESGILHVEWPDDGGRRDRLHAVDIELQVSDGTNLSVEFRGNGELDLDAVRADETWALSTPLLPGDEVRSYRLSATDNRPSSSIGRVFLHLSDAVGARFAIRSVRLVFDREQLAETPSGVSWRGLDDIFHESIVTKAPEAIRIPVTLSERPWLDLSIGTMDQKPATFRVEAQIRGPAGGEGSQVLLERTVTTPDRWERVPVDLTALAGQDVTLSLALEAGEPGVIGLWGSPVVRHRETREAGTRSTPQGVIVVMADTIRPDHLGVYGHDRDTTPALARLAAAGTRFNDSVAQATWTKVSTPSILTSLYPTSHTVTDVPDRLPSSATTLAELYRATGHATLSFSSVSFSGAATNLHQGFEELHEAASRNGPNQGKSAREYVDRLLPWLDLHRDVPFFVFLHLFDPHSPFEPRPPYNTMWADPAGRTTHENRVAEVRPHIDSPFLRGQVMPSRADLDSSGIDVDAFMAYRKAWYDGSIRGMDAEIGRLLEHLEQLDLADRVVVAVVGDHGEEFLEHGNSWHGQSVYGELTRVPLILWAPGRLPAGRQVDETVRTIDLMPTLLELSGMGAPDTLQGQSLMPLLGADATTAGPGWIARPAVSEEHVRADAGADDRHESFALILNGWRLIHNTARETDEPEYELYDHLEDPLNLTDVAADHPEVVERLAAELERWRRRSEAARLPADDELTDMLSAEELERLRSLGYLR
ncbi:MAG: sulfatase [Vicinamibacterales bacterium]|jgi:arylsulfatase A-like enzyme|nr:sulfatase [Vicinamibacterales bacterium]